MEFRPKNDRGQYKVTLCAPEDRHLFNNPERWDEFDFCEEIQEFINQEHFGSINALIAGKWAAIYFSDELDRMHFKMKFCEGRTDHGG